MDETVSEAGAQGPDSPGGADEDPLSVRRRTWRAVGPAAAVFASMTVAIALCVGFPCMGLGLTHGIWTDRCPTGELRLDVEARAYDLVRGSDHGRLVVSPRARWIVGDDRYAAYFGDDLHRGVTLSADLVDAAGEVVASIGPSAFRSQRSQHTADLALPELPDGDYVLRVDADAGFERRTVDLEVPLYTPALVHVMTDRPLYKPGQLVQFRAAVLARTDRAPLEDRPGRWTVTAPSGLEMFVERGGTGPWGVVAGSLPLDPSSEIGTWTVAWQSGDDRAQSTFDVRRFALPRLSVEVGAVEPWAGPSAPLRFSGRATYTSGAPVARARAEARLRVTTGRWPLPLAWEEPRLLRTDSDGRFALDFGRVPLDLMDRAELSLQVRVTDEAGETVMGHAATVLSPESLRLDAVTELGDGVVGGFNNRVYVRVATPDGRPLPGARVEVRPPNDPDAARIAVADASGVIAMQLDPGDPITVVDKAPPVRSRPLKANPVRLVAATMGGGGEIDLPLRRALDAVHPAIARCGRLTIGDRVVPVGVRLGTSGRPGAVMAPPDPLGRCLERAMGQLRAPSGPLRTLALSWSVPDSQHPSLRLDHQTAFGDGIDAALEDAAIGARRCLPFARGVDGAELGRVHWSVEGGSRRLTTLVEPGYLGGLPGWSWRCMRDTFLALRTLPEAADGDRMGTATVFLRVPSTGDGPPPEDRTRTAYAMQVTARDPADGSSLGEGRLVLPVGSLPDLRLRATPALAAPGDELTIELLRGPEFLGRLPESLVLRQGSVEIEESDVDDNRATFTLPDDASGFFAVEHDGARAVVFVRPPDPLSVTVTSDRAVLRPGGTATLTVSTTADGAPEPAAVGLSGVDATLGTLAPLPGPDDLGRATVRAESLRPAFGVFDPVALALGQVAGEHAAMATVLRVGALPSDPAGDRPVSTSVDSFADVDTPLTLGFYRTLETAVGLVRAWEASAPDDEMLTAERMVAFWTLALEELEGSGEPAVDGFGRPLTLAVLPEALLRQVDPRQVASDGTRLPEDVVNWMAYVDTQGRLR